MGRLVARPLVAALWLRFLQPEADCNCSGGASASTIGTVCVCCMYHGQGKRAGDQLSFALTRSRLFLLLHSYASGASVRFVVRLACVPAVSV